MNVYIYETESIAYEGDCVGIVIIIAKNREAADRAMFRDPSCRVSNQRHLETVYKVEEKPLSYETTIFHGKVLERLDEHDYTS